MKIRNLSNSELDAVSGGAFLSYNTINYGSGNGGISGSAVAVNALGYKQSNNVQTGSANGAAGGAFSMVNSGKILGGFI